MLTQTNAQQHIPLTVFVWSGEKYEVRDIISFFYKASHKNKSAVNDEWVALLEMQLDRLKAKQFLQGSSCTAIQSQWVIILNNVIQAVTQFEASYKANCPCAGLLPSPFIKRVRRIQQSAALALFHIEV